MSPGNVVISRDARGLSPPQPYKLSALGQAGSPSGPLSAAFQGLNFEKIPLARGQERGLRSPSRSQPEGDYLAALREFWTHFYFVFPLFGQKTRSRRFFAHRIFEKIEIIFGDYQHKSIDKKIIMKRKNRERGGGAGFSLKFGRVGKDQVRDFGVDSKSGQKSKAGSNSNIFWGSFSTRFTIKTNKAVSLVFLLSAFVGRRKM